MLLFTDFSGHCYHSALIKHNPVDVATWTAHPWTFERRHPFGIRCGNL